MSKLKRALKGTLAYKIARKVKRKYTEFVFERQKQVKGRVGNFELFFPSRHPLLHIQKTQPYRDLCIGIAAGCLGHKYPGSAIIDIGANIGDSAAHMATHCSNDLILIEPSSFFLPYLKMNSQKFPNKTTVENVIIGSQDMKAGHLVHWGGTAYFEMSASASENNFNTKQLADFPGEICFVKIDTDGNDFGIITNNLEWIKTKRCGIILESEIRSDADLQRANIAFELLKEAGYKYFVFFDDPGFMMCSTTDIDQVMSLNRYQYKIWTSSNQSKSISNFDVLCLHERDFDVYNRIQEHYMSY